ncbi:Uncharacterised protein [Chromobacterium violaceum]|uniref:Uncharacterized protein n=1 Tax=Chromobacterium violaceum TaxID=536 RepID=A0A3S4LKZ4_CHRVL|nr:Uncharacterised protein [Chromobacterium violaceum]
MERVLAQLDDGERAALESGLRVYRRALSQAERQRGYVIRRWRRPTMASWRR